MLEMGTLPLPLLTWEGQYTHAPEVSKSIVSNIMQILANL